jgi:hypothetical protein
MYTVDQMDTVVKLTNVPQSSIGAPCPMLLAGESHVHLAYYLQNTPHGWDASTVRVLDESSGDEPCALVEFRNPYAHMFGPPNDEAFEGHPLASRGLNPYGAFEVSRSSWLRLLERMNSVHPYHKAEHFEAYKHFVFSFHDTTFECIAKGFEVSLHRGSVAAVLRLARSEV